MNTMPDLLSATVTILAVILYSAMSMNVGRMRVKHGVKPPATTGNTEFERAFRVQMNTLENLPVFLAMLWLATVYFTLAPWLPASLGLLWIVGRILYMRAYLRDPKKRGPGFGVSALAQVGLMIAAAIGVGMAFIG
jgi:glutathione S-transferase